MYGKLRNAYKILILKSEGYHSGDTGVDEKIILTWGMPVLRD
jgi:hypothetical protein